MIRVLIVDDQALVRSGFRVILDSEPDLEVVGEAANGAEAVRLAERFSPDVICMDVEMPVMNGIEASRRILDPRPEAAAAGAPAILILTTFGHEQYLFDALAAGVSGFLLKTSRAEQLIDAVRALAAGNALLGPDVTRAVIARVASDRSVADRGGSDSVGDPRPAFGGAWEPVAAHPTGSQAPPKRTGGVAAGAGTPGTGAAGSGKPAPAPPEPDAATRAGLTEREREVLSLLAEGRSNAEIASALFLGEATVKTHVSNLLQKLAVRDRIQAVVWAHTRGAV